MLSKKNDYYQLNSNCSSLLLYDKIWLTQWQSSIFSLPNWTAKKNYITDARALRCAKKNPLQNIVVKKLSNSKMQKKVGEHKKKTKKNLFLFFTSFLFCCTLTNLTKCILLKNR